MKDEHSDRRTFLKASAASLAGLTGLVGSVAGDDGPVSLLESADGPVLATGKRFHRYEPLGDGEFRHEERFVSDELVDTYGKATVRFEDEVVSRETARHELKENGTTVLRYEDTAVIGTGVEHARRESNARPSAAEREDGVSVASHPFYYGPSFVYKLDDDGTLGEASGPLNVTWLNDTPFSVQYTMLNDDDWSNHLPAGDRYIVDDSGGYREQWGHIMKSDFYTAQYHGRLFRIDDVGNNYYTACQMHYDPVDHGHLGDPDTWKFDESREEMLDFWLNDEGYTVNYQDRALGQWESADDYIGKLMG